MLRSLQLFLTVLVCSAFLSCGGGGGGSGDKLSPADADSGNLHLIDQQPNGFAVYRSGAPSQENFEQWCALGVSEVMVLSGNAGAYEEKFQNLCPTLRVVYDEEQESSEPLSASFLRTFDSWVESAQNTGQTILFRCNCGCHRTGRLAGYYEMKYLGASYDQASAHLVQYGTDMDSHQFLFPQLQGLQDYIKGRPCGVEAEYCVRDE